MPTYLTAPYADAALIAGPEAAAPNDAKANPSPLAPTDTGPRPPAAAHAAQQIAESIRNASHPPPLPGSLDVALHPEELGRVRLVFTPTEAGLSISVQAERGETLDMLRRHIELLEQDLREHGFSNPSFDFSGGSHGDRATQDGPQTGLSQGATNTAVGGGPSAAPSPLPAHPDLTGGAGLDLRL
ncbi:MAG: flagellar hook-length control protein FliK [Pseudomonadota bacterium]